MSTYTKYAEQQEGEQLVCMPVLVVADLEEDEFPGAKGVKNLQGKSCYHSTKEARVPVRDDYWQEGGKHTSAT